MKWDDAKPNVTHRVLVVINKIMLGIDSHEHTLYRLGPQGVLFKVWRVLIGIRVKHTTGWQHDSEK